MFTDSIEAYDYIVTYFSKPFADYLFENYATERIMFLTENNDKLNKMFNNYLMEIFPYKLQGVK